jgi:anti-sigma regulatory factor (Ser/Thr protein kinase)
MSAEHPSFEDLSAVDQPEQEQETVRAQEQHEVLHPGSFEGRFEWESNDEAIGEAEMRARESCAVLKWPEEKTDELVHAVRVAVKNAVMHNLEISAAEDDGDAIDGANIAAEQSDGAAQKVSMEIYASERKMRVVVEDKGDFVGARPTPVPGSAIEDHSIMLDNASMAEMVENCDQVDSEPGRLTLIKYRDGRPEAAGAEGWEDDDDGDENEGNL